MESSRVKRQKVAIACDPCRQRKVKCDGRQPICEPCQKKAGTGITCSWKPSPLWMSGQMPVGSIRWLEMRPEPPSEPVPASPSSSGTVQYRASMQPPIYHPTYSASPDSSEHSVHAIIGATVDEDSREGFFGSSSAGTFMQSVKRIVQQSSGPSPLQGLPYSGHITTKPESIEYVLPMRRRADVLMSIYWQYVHTLYPYLDKMQVELDYECLWKADSSIAEERSFMCLLNAIFALSSQIDESTPIQERDASSKMFYKRARSLLDIVETGSIRSVQSSLLLGQYFQSTNEPHSCWVYTGIAIRTAQSLGLNLPENSERTTDIRTRELLRKVWHGCILMDRVVAMIYGRPCMIGPRAGRSVPFPIPVDEEYLSTSSFEMEPAERRRTANVEFYVYTLKLYEILHDVIFNFYSVNNSHSDNEVLESFSGEQSSIFEIDRKILEWEQSIPDRLRVRSRELNGQPTTNRQAVILHQRQLHVRLMLLRPILSKFIASDVHDDNHFIPLGSLLSHRVSLQCALVCVKVAIEVIDTIFRERGKNSGDIGSCAAWWYNVLYLYTSATILIAARTSSSILAEVPEESILVSWNKATEILEGYSSFGTSIKRLSTTLRLLSEAVPRQYSRFKENYQQNCSDVMPDAQSHIQSLRSPHPVDSMDTIPITVDDSSRENLPDNNITLPSDSMLDFDGVFDLNDPSWLLTIPLGT